MHTRDRQAAAAVALTLAVALFALGSAPRWATCLAAGLSAACALPYLRSSRQLEGSWRSSPVLLLLALAFAFTAAQLVPLPAGLVALLSPARHELAIANAAALSHGAPAFLPLTLDGPATLVELGKLAGYVLFAYACVRLAGKSRGRELILSAIAAVAAAVAVTALAHEAVGASAVFGLYEPEQAAPVLVSPLLNPNHLSAFMAFGAALSLGLALAATSARRVAWIAAALTCAGVSLLSASRGGAAALVIGAVVTAVLYARQRRRGARDRAPLPRSTAIGIGVVTLCAVLLIGVFTAGGVASQIAATRQDEFTSGEGRIGAWRSAGVLLHDHFATGVGRGAFVHAFPRVHHTNEVTFAYLENEYLQAAVDWGVPAAAVLAAALVLLAVAAVRRGQPSPREAGAMGGLAALALQNAVDFNLELPGVALCAIAATACLVPAKLSRPRKRVGRRPVLLRAGAVCAGAAVVALAASPLGRTARADTDRAESAAAAERAFARHPSDYVAAGNLARELFQRRDSRAVAVANRALSLNPAHPGLHLLAARMLLAAQHPDQALLEYALALEHHRGAAIDLVSELVARFPQPERAVEGLPLDSASFHRLLPSVRQVTPELAVLYGRQLVEIGQADPAALVAVSDLEREHGDPSRALDAARRAHDQAATPSTAMALARSLAVTGATPAALEVLEQALEATGPGVEETELRLTLADLHTDAGDLTRARDILSALAETVVDNRTRAGIHRKLARVETALGNTHQAAWHERRAAELRARR